jgi:eukaryotic-like serine/threonine-protein kinase
MGAISSPRLSHDGGRVAITRMGEGATAAGDIWVYDLERGLGTRLTTDPAHDHPAVWSPNDEWIIFRSDRRGTGNLYRKRSNGVGSEEMLPMSGFHGEARSWSGQSIIANDLTDGSDLWHLTLPQQTAMVLSKTPFREWDGEISRDGRYIAYVSNETGRFEVYVRTFPPSGERWLVSKTGGSWPKWRGDGRELFFIDDSTRTMMVAEVHPGAASPLRVPQPLFAATMMLHEGSLGFDVSADGQRFLVIKAAAYPGAGRITLIQNWTAGLTQ